MKKFCRLLPCLLIGMAVLCAGSQAEAVDDSAIEVTPSFTFTAPEEPVSFWAKTTGDVGRMRIEIKDVDGSVVYPTADVVCEREYDSNSGRYEWNGVDVLMWDKYYAVSYSIEGNDGPLEISQKTLINEPDYGDEENFPLNKPELIWPPEGFNFDPGRPVPLFWSPVESSDNSEVTYRLFIAAYDMEKEGIESSLPHRDENELFDGTTADEGTELDNNMVLITTPDKIPYVFSDVKAGFVYYWKVEVSDNYGNSSPSEVRWFFGDDSTGGALVWFQLVIQDIKGRGVQCDSDDITLFKHTDTDTPSPYRYMMVESLKKHGEFIVVVGDVYARDVFDLEISVDNYLLSENKNLELYELDAPSIPPVQIEVEGDYNRDAIFNFNDVEAAFQSFAGISDKQSGLTLDDVKAVFDLYQEFNEGSI